MPYAFQYNHAKIPEHLDRRRKIPISEHAYIIERHKRGEAIRAIARHYGVDKKLIQLIIFPDRLARHKALYKANRKDGRYYNKEAHTKAIRTHRRYKQSIKDKLTN